MQKLNTKMTSKERLSTSQENKGSVDKNKINTSQKDNKKSDIQNSPDKANPKNQSLIDPNSPMRQVLIKPAGNNFQNDLDSPFRKKKDEFEIKSNIINLQKIDESDSLNITFQEMISNIDTEQFINKISVKSKPGQTEKKIAKINQDSFISISNFMENNSIHLFGVCDGHGQFGHHASQFIKQYLPKNIQKNIQAKPTATMQNILIESFKQTNNELIKSDINCDFSGSKQTIFNSYISLILIYILILIGTTVVCLLIGKHLFTANLGDSRAILVSKKGSQFSFTELSQDQKPELPEERERIIKAGGRVEQYKDDREGFIGPYRVWFKFEQLPGLAMSRSFGDQVAAKVGVIAIPEVTYHKITKDDRYITICSDGVWEFLQNNDVMELVNPFYLKTQPEQACDKLISESVMWWKKEDEVVDDITALCVFLKE